MSTCVSIMSFLKVVDRSSSLGMNILRPIYGWTCHHWRTCVISSWRLRVGALYFLFGSAFYHRVSGFLVELLSRGARLQFYFLGQICSAAEFCFLNNIWLCASLDAETGVILLFKKINIKFNKQSKRLENKAVTLQRHQIDIWDLQTTNRRGSPCRNHHYSWWSPLQQVYKERASTNVLRTTYNRISYIMLQCWRQGMWTSLQKCQLYLENYSMLWLWVIL